MILNSLSNTYVDILILSRAQFDAVRQSFIMQHLDFEALYEAYQQIEYKKIVF